MATFSSSSEVRLCEGCSTLNGEINIQDEMLYFLLSGIKKIYVGTHRGPIYTERLKKSDTQCL